MLDKIYICFIAFLPFIALFDTEPQMYNMYMLNVMVGLATIYAAVISWHRKYNLIISGIDIIMVVFLTASLLSATINNKPIHLYIYVNFCCNILLIIIAKNIVQFHIPLFCRALCVSIISLSSVILIVFIFTDTKTFFIIIDNKMGNTGICAIFLAIAICIMLHFSCHTRSKYQNLALTIFIILCFYVIKQSECRTALFMVATYCLYGFFQKKQDNKKFTLMIVLLVIVGCILIISVDISKVNSIIGRHFIVRNSLGIFHSSPLVGQGGLGSFAVNHALYQSKWFSSHHAMDEFFILADNVVYASNEYLQTLCESGLCGIITLMFFMWYIVMSLKKYVLLLSCFVLPLFLAASFYYILHVALFCAITLTLCIIASSCCKKRIILSKKSAIPCCLIVMFGTLFTSYDIRHYHVAKKIYYTMEHDSITHSQAIDVLNRFGENRALMALVAATYTDSTGEIYNDIERNFLHSDMLWMEGRNLLRIGCDSLGEEKLLLASMMVPNRFRYNYELLQLYRKQNDKTKCRIIAKKIFHMPEKIPSPTVTAIKMEAQKELENDF